MIVTLALLGYALAVATLGSTLLSRARWPESAPRAGIVAWQALSVSTLASVVLAGLLAAFPVLPGTVGLADFLRTCAMLLRAQYATPAGAIAASVGLVIAGSVLGRVGYCGVRAGLGIARGRRDQRRRLGMLTDCDPATGMLVLDHPRAAAYSLPGRGGRVVVTTGALAQLERPELEAVLAHECAHLRSRHDLVVAAAIALRDAFPFVPVFAAAADQMPVLVEMAADDVATRSADRVSLGQALVRLAGAPTPSGLLGAGEATAVARVRRLAAPHRGFGPIRTLATSGAVLTVLALPVLIAIAPAVAVAGVNLCPVPVTA